MKRLKYWLLFHLLLCLPIIAQTTFQEQAARLQNINAFLLDLRPGSAPIRARQSALVLSVDITPQPDVDTRVGNKDEPVDPPSVVPRLRLRWETRMGLFLGGTYVPGLEMEDYEADYYALEAGWMFDFGKWRTAIRGSVTDGDVTGPITEEDVDDFFVFENRGFDFSLGRTLWNFEAYGFVGYGETDTSLDIQSDGVRLENEEDVTYGGLGVSWRTDHWSLNLEQNITDDYLKHLVLSVGYRF